MLLIQFCLQTLFCLPSGVKVNESGNGACETIEATTFTFGLRVDVRRSVLIGPCTFGIEITSRLTTSNAWALHLVFLTYPWLFTREIYLGKCRSRTLSAISRGKTVILSPKLCHQNFVAPYSTDNRGNFEEVCFLSFPGCFFNSHFVIILVRMNKAKKAFQLKLLKFAPSSHFYF